MSKVRFVHCKFWEDNEVLEMTPDEKCFYLYLLTNSKTSSCGVYEISVKTMAFETGIDKELVLKLINRFQNQYKKILYDLSTGEIAIRNWFKYNKNDSPHVVAKRKKDETIVKNKELLKYVKGDEYDMDKVSIPYGHDTGFIDSKIQRFKDSKIQEEEVREIPEEEIINIYNEQLPELSRVEKITKSRKTAIKERWKSDKTRQNLTWWKEYFVLVKNTPFLLGDNPRGWRANFDFLICEEKMIRVIEGAYTINSPPAREPPQKHGQGFMLCQEMLAKEVSKSDKTTGDHADGGFDLGIPAPDT